MPDIIYDLYWMDIFFVILLLGMIYRGLMIGVGSQLISLIGWFLLIFATIGFYNSLAGSVFGFLLKSWAKPASFFVIIAAVFSGVKFIEKVFNISTVEEISVIERFLGAFISIARAFVLFGIVSLLLLLVPMRTTYMMVTERSKLAMNFINLDIGIYVWIKGLINTDKNFDKQVILDKFMGAYSISDEEKR